MINKNLNWSAEQTQPLTHQPTPAQPFLLSPIGKDYLWGGTRLKEDYAKNIDLDPLAETWECSTHPDGLSTVASGEFKGQTLAQVLKKHPEFLGTHPRTKGELPILIKMIDARKDLSVQVHPNDSYAWEYEHGQQGKTEMWYVLDAAKDAKLVYGFRNTVTPQQVRKSIETGTIEKYLQKVPVKKDDVFFVPAGCVHAIGAGALIVEVQQSSNLTYRLYDYGRTDKDGKQRALHVDKALAVADLSGSAEPRQPIHTYRFSAGMESELLCRCKYFQAERVRLNTERCREKACIQTGNNSFQVLLCTRGCGVLLWGNNEMLEFYKGDCIFVPANSHVIKIHGQAQFLKVSC